MSTQWGKVDRANNSPIWATARVNKTANSVNQAALYNNTTANAYFTGANGTVEVGTFGVSVAEMSDAGIGQVASVTVATSGTGFTVRPTVVFTNGGATTQATGNTTAKVVSATIYAGGTNYAPGNVVTINTTGAAGATTAAKFNVLTVNSAASNTVLTVSINTAGSFTTFPTQRLQNQTTNTVGVGSGLTLNLAFGLLAVSVTTNGVGYTSAPTVTIGGSGGTGATATAELRSEQAKVTSAGWVLRKKFGNRVQYETLVAMKSITGDGSDDTQLPE
jgi:hypothetical protein